MGVDTVPPHNANAAAAEASGLVWGHLARKVANPGIAAAQLARALLPVWGATWNRDVVTSDAVGGTNIINSVCCMMRNFSLIRAEYDRVLAFLKEAYADASLSP